MTTTTRKWIACALILGTLAFLAESAHAEKYPKAIKGIKVFSPPEDRVVLTNGTAFFAVVTEPSSLHSQPLTFQWQKNGTNMAGRIYPSLHITNVQVSDVGFYSCVISRGSTSLKVGSEDPDAPGARLFVIESTNTAVSGPVQPGTGTRSCVGSYTGCVLFKTIDNSSWWTPPTGATNCTITDTSRTFYTPQYVPVVQWADNYLNNSCATNQVSFPVVSGRRYQFTTYIKNTMPPPNSGDRLTLDVTWGP